MSLPNHALEYVISDLTRNPGYLWTLLLWPQVQTGEKLVTLKFSLVGVLEVRVAHVVQKNKGGDVTLISPSLPSQVMSVRVFEPRFWSRASSPRTTMDPY